MVINLNHFGSTPEQQLTASLADEIINQRGLPCKYLKKSHVNLDAIFGEDNLVKFEHAVDIYMLPDSPEHFGGQGETFADFGFVLENSFQMNVETGRFASVVGKDSPEEGDLVYIPVLGRWFSVNHHTEEGTGDNTVPFFWQGKNACFSIGLSTLHYSHETIETEDEIVDENLPLESNQTQKDNENVKDEVKETNLIDEWDRLLKG